VARVQGPHANISARPISRHPPHRLAHTENPQSRTARSSPAYVARASRSRPGPTSSPPPSPRWPLSWRRLAWFMVQGVAGAVSAPAGEDRNGAGGPCGGADPARASKPGELIVARRAIFVDPDCGSHEAVLRCLPRFDPHFFVLSRRPLLLSQLRASLALGRAAFTG